MKHLVALVAFVLSIPVPVLGQDSAGVFLEPEALTVAPQDDAGVLRSRIVNIDFDRLDAARDAVAGAGAAPPQLELNLFDDATFTALIDEVSPTDAGYALTGRLDGVALGSFALVVNGETVAGSLAALEAVYTVRSMGTGQYLIRQVDQSALPREDEPLLPDPAEVPPLGGDADGLLATALDGGSEITVAVFYTPTARIAEGGTSNIESLIDLAETETNLAYATVGVIQRIAAVHKQEISYTEVSSSTDLNRLRLTSDGYLDEVHAIRDTYGADLVHLITDASYCGRGYYAALYGATYGFAVTDRNCVSPNYTFAHELGHNMGLRHDRYMDQGNTPYPYSHGYVNQAALEEGAPSSKRWRTIMAYNDECSDNGISCTRKLWFSNPSDTYGGDPLGVSGTDPSSSEDGPADAQLSLDNTRVTVANFRNLSCANSVSPTSATAAPAGATGSISVTAISVCSWTAVSNASWITVTGGASGSGNGTTSYSVAANTGTARTGTITIAGNTFTVTQTGGFTDYPLVAGTSTLKAVHITELRTRIDSLRVSCGLSAYSYTDATLTAESTTAKEVHITDLRTALGEAYVACGSAAPTYTDPSLTAGSTIVKAVHIAELRAAVIALE